MSRNSLNEMASLKIHDQNIHVCLTFSKDGEEVGKQ